MSALLKQQQDQIFANASDDREENVSDLDELFGQAVQRILDLDDRGIRLDVNVADVPYNALVQMQEQLRAFGMSNNVAQAMVDALETQATQLGADFTRKEKPTPLEISVRVADKRPQLDNSKTHFMVAFDGKKKYGSEYSTAQMHLTNQGTKTSTTNIPALENMFMSGEKYVIIHFEKLSAEALKGMEAGGMKAQAPALDDAGLAKVELLEAVGPRASRAAIEPVASSIDNKTITPQQTQLIQTVAQLNRTVETIARSPEPVAKAPEIVKQATQPVNKAMQTMTQAGQLPKPVILDAVINAQQRSEVVANTNRPAILQPQAMPQVLKGDNVNKIAVVASAVRADVPGMGVEAPKAAAPAKPAAMATPSEPVAAAPVAPKAIEIAALAQPQISTPQAVRAEAPRAEVVTPTQPPVRTEAPRVVEAARAEPVKFEAPRAETPRVESLRAEIPRAEAFVPAQPTVSIETPRQQAPVQNVAEAPRVRPVDIAPVQYVAEVVKPVTPVRETPIATIETPVRAMEMSRAEIVTPVQPILRTEAPRVEAPKQEAPVQQNVAEAAKPRPIEIAPIKEAPVLSTIRPAIVETVVVETPAAKTESPSSAKADVAAVKIETVIVAPQAFVADAAPVARVGGISTPSASQISAPQIVQKTVVVKEEAAPTTLAKKADIAAQGQQGQTPPQAKASAANPQITPVTGVQLAHQVNPNQIQQQEKSTKSEGQTRDKQKELDARQIERDRMAEEETKEKEKRKAQDRERERAAREMYGAEMYNFRAWAVKPEEFKQVQQKDIFSRTEMKSITGFGGGEGTSFGGGSKIESALKQSFGTACDGGNCGSCKGCSVSGAKSYGPTPKY